MKLAGRIAGARVEWVLRLRPSHTLALTILIAAFSVTGAIIAGSFRPTLAEGQIAGFADGRPAHAILIFIGDGMGQGQRTAARWAAVGQNGQLAMDKLQFNGWAHTTSAGGAITESAAAATALATGVKTTNGKVAMDPSGQTLTTILEFAQARGMSVGLVTTTAVTDATPAAFATHVPSRDQRAEIARQMLEAGVDLLLGGCENDFLPTTMTGHYPLPGNRTDGRDLISEAILNGYTYVNDSAGLAAVDPASTSRLIGLFSDQSMTRPFSPSLAEMTQKAIDILSRNPRGFFLMIEGGQIDIACHSNDAVNAIADTIGFDQAVSLGTSYASGMGNTLILVTADHETGGMSANLIASGSANEDGPFLMPDGTQFFVNWTTTTHTSANVPNSAQGPGADLLVGDFENTHVFDAMLNALDWRVWIPFVSRN